MLHVAAHQHAGRKSTEELGEWGSGEVQHPTFRGIGIEEGGGLGREESDGIGDRKKNGCEKGGWRRQRTRERRPMQKVVAKGWRVWKTRERRLGDERKEWAERKRRGWERLKEKQ